MNKITNSQITVISRIVLIFSDIMAVLAAALYAYTFFETDARGIVPRYYTLIGVVLFALSILFWSQTIYEQYSTRRSFYDEFRELINIFLLNSFAALSAIFLLDLSAQKSKHLLFLFVSFILIIFLRMLARHLLDYFGLWRKDCLIICPQSEYAYTKAALESQFNLGLRVRRGSLERRNLANIVRKINSSNSSVYQKLRQEVINYYSEIGSPQIVLFFHKNNAEHISSILELLIHTSIPYSIIPDVGGSSLLGMRVSHFFRWELLLITPQNNIKRISYRIIKRLIDIIVSIICLFALSIPMFIIYAIIKLEGGAAIFSQQRIGMNKRLFWCYKFRTMHDNSSEILDDFLKLNPNAKLIWQKCHKLDNDPRITRFGKFLRRSSLDELPQLFNVFLGDMSLVGPRPITRDELAKYGKDIELYYMVRPGITGLWQISGRSNTVYDYRVSLDAWYVKNWSIWYDLAILIKTITVVLSREGAY